MLPVEPLVKRPSNLEIKENALKQYRIAGFFYAELYFRKSLFSWTIFWHY